MEIFLAGEDFMYLTISINFYLIAQNLQLVADGCCNLQKQIQITQLFGVPVVVALNVFK